jgi:hypothetical protein
VPIHPRSGRLILACRLVVAGWVLLGVFFAGFAAFLAVAPAGVTSRQAVAVLLTPVVLVIAMETGIAWTLRCPACNGFVLLQTSGPFHPAARRWIVGGTYAPIVVDLLRHRRFTCMYCGEACRVDDPASPPGPG